MRLAIPACLETVRAKRSSSSIVCLSFYLSIRCRPSRDLPLSRSIQRPRRHLNARPHCHGTVLPSKARTKDKTKRCLKVIILFDGTCYCCLQYLPRDVSFRTERDILGSYRHARFPHSTVCYSKDSGKPACPLCSIPFCAIRCLP